MSGFPFKCLASSLTLQKPAFGRKTKSGVAIALARRQLPSEGSGLEKIRQGYRQKGRGSSRPFGRILAHAGDKLLSQLEEKKKVLKVMHSASVLYKGTATTTNPSHFSMCSD
jgi:hypothetical protein